MAEDLEGNLTELGRKLMIQEQRTNENRDQYIQDRVQRIQEHLNKVESTSRTMADDRSNGANLHKQLNIVEKLKKGQSVAEKSKQDFLKDIKEKVTESIVKNEQSVISNKQRLRKEDRERITYLK